MDANEIRAAVKNSIAKVTGINAQEISDEASYKEDLGLDSLSIIEIAVDVECRFRVKASDEELSAIRTVADTVRLLQQYLGAKVT